MHVQIEREAGSLLPVIEELPHAKLAMLEGLNGIGKTLAIRVLQLCTGQMPYRRESLAWRSLCSDLGEFEVTVNDLADGNEIVWHAQSSDWAGRPELEPTTEWFQSITIDGVASTLDAVRQIFTVHRLAGDEGIVETFASLAEADAAVVRRWAARYAAAESGPLSSLETASADARELLGDWTLAKYVLLEQGVATSARAVAVSAAEFEQARTRSLEVDQAVELARQLADIRSRAPELTGQLELINAQIMETRSTREGLQQQIAAAAASIARTAPARHELELARRTLERNRRNLSSAQERASSSAAQLAIEPEHRAAGELIAQLERSISELRTEETTLNAAPAMRAVLDEVTNRLGVAESSGLGAEVALEDAETGIQLTVSETRRGMTARRSYLEGQPPPPQARDVAERIQTARNDLTRAQRLSSIFDEVDRYRRLVNANEDRVEAALRGSAGATSTLLRELEERRRSVDETLLDLAGKRAALAAQLGVSDEGTNEETIAARLSLALSTLSVSSEELDALQSRSADESNEAQLRLASAREESAVTRRTLARAEADIRRSAAALRSAPAMTWIRRAMPTATLDQNEESIRGLVVALDAAMGIADAVIDRLSRHRVQLAAVGEALDALARQLRGLEPGAIEYTDELCTWLESRFGEWFNRPGVRQELLPESQGPITVNLVSRTVSWRESSAVRSRPLEAFSSGEQAFAYTRARIAVLDEEISHAANRLIVLDEFGAFMAHDRLQALLTYLRERTRDHITDQVMVVLPLGRDYAAEAASAVGPEAAHWRKLADEVSERKYAVRVLEP